MKDFGSKKYWFFTGMGYLIYAGVKDTKKLWVYLSCVTGYIFCHNFIHASHFLFLFKYYIYKVCFSISFHTIMQYVFVQYYGVQQEASICLISINISCISPQT